MTAALRLFGDGRHPFGAKVLAGRIDRVGRSFLSAWRLVPLHWPGWCMQVSCSSISVVRLSAGTLGGRHGLSSASACSHDCRCSGSRTTQNPKEILTAGACKKNRITLESAVASANVHLAVFADTGCFRSQLSELSTGFCRFDALSREFGC